jgi:hypothetical protein
MLSSSADTDAAKGNRARDSDSDDGGEVTATAAVHEESAYTGSEIHVADSPGGPFLPLKTSYSGCNNPSPWVMTNGTILVLCTWKIIAAEALEGPWRTVLALKINPSTRMGESGNWCVVIVAHHLCV